MNKETVLGLMRQVKPLGKELIFSPAINAEIELFERTHGIPLPAEMREWFGVCNGANVNPGGLLSLFSPDKGVSVDWYLNQYPFWKSNGWLPIAGDGCGNMYIVMTADLIPSAQTHPVAFFDQCDNEKPAYLVGSGILNFLGLLFEDQILSQARGKGIWPFNKEAVLARDPHLAECKSAPLPWECDVQ